jgi:tryptophan halogenase
MSEALRDIVIVGGGLAGWYSAARLAQGMRGRNIRIRVIHAAPAGDEPDPLDVFCASTLPSQSVAHLELGLEERDWMRACNATFKLASGFRGFAPSRSHMLPFGEIGARLEAVGFHQFISRLMHAGEHVDLDEFSVPALAARLGRFAHPSQDARSVLSTYEYAYHLDTRAYTQRLRNFALQAGASAIDADLGDVECNPDRQRVTALQLADGTRITGDLYIDCTGARSAVLGQALGVPFDSWQAWLPCGHAVTTRTKAQDAGAPFTRITRQPAGWAWQVPLSQGVEQALVFDARRRDPRSVLAEAPSQGEALLPVRSLEFLNGRRRESWRGNCVAVGAAAGFLEPLVSSGLRLIDDGVTRLVALFPDTGDFALMAAEYNRMMGATFDGARDFAIAHYLPERAATSPRDEMLAALPASLRQRVELFRYRGRVVLHDDEIFEETDWACAFIGLGERPQHYSILAEQSGLEDLRAQLAKISRVMRDAVQKLPPHAVYLERYLA